MYIMSEHNFWDRIITSLMKKTRICKIIIFYLQFNDTKNSLSLIVLLHDVKLLHKV